MPTYGTKENPGLYPEFLDERLMKQNCTNKMANPDQCMNRRMLKANKVKSKQDQETLDAIEIINRGLVLVNNTIYPVIELEMDPSIDSDWNDLQFTWECTDFKPLYIDIKLNYTRFPSVSIHENKDKLTVKFNGHWYFKSRENNQFIEQLTSNVQKQVPLQLHPDSRMQSVTDLVKNTSKTVLVFHFLVNLLLGSAIQQLFNSIRKLSIMIHMLIISVNIPANTQFFFAHLFGFVSFDIVEMEPFIRPLLRLYNDEVANENFYNLGYPSNYYVINIGNLAFGILYFILLYSFYIVTKF